MKKILENMDAAASGNKPSTGAKDVNDMKAILESIQSVEECGDMPMMAGQEMNQSQGNPVTVSISASGKDNVTDLMDLIKLAGGNTEQHVDMPMAHDAHIDTDSHNVSGQEMDMDTMRQIMAAGERDKETEEEVEEWSNSPEGAEAEEEYRDHEYMTRDLSGGINREKPKGSERVKDPAVESVKEQLWAALNEKKTTEGQGRGKKKLKASRGNEDIKTTEGSRGKKSRGKKSRG